MRRRSPGLTVVRWSAPSGARGQVDPVFLDVVEDLPQILGDLVADGDIVVTMGAGNIRAVAAAMAEAMCPWDENTPRRAHGLR